MSAQSLENQENFQQSPENQENLSSENTQPQENPEVFDKVPECSLTNPLDREKDSDGKPVWKPALGQEPLSNEEAKYAMKDLSKDDYVNKYRALDRTYADKQIPMQLYGLFSFIPTKNAKPDENGLYGFAKLRGNFQSQIEAEQRAEEIIRYEDSYNKIFHCYVGRPFPVTVSSQFSEVIDEIDIQKESAKTVSSNIKEKKDHEKQEIRNIQEREQKLKEESKKDEVDPYEDYICQKTKIATLSFTFLQHQEKMAEIKEIILKTRGVIKEYDNEYPHYKDNFFEKYMNARREAGIVDDPKTANDNFVKFMVEDAPLGF